MEKFYGKYRALVSKNNDPNTMGRIKVRCPLVLGDAESDWCIPCLPVVADLSTLVIPKINSGVWIEFENGDLNKPLWVGTWLAIGTSTLTIQP